MSLIILNIFLFILVYYLLKMVKIKKLNERKCLIWASITTFLIHNITWLYHLFIGDDLIAFFKLNPNLIFPIYPCNVVMYSLIIYGFLKDKNSKFGKILADFNWYFGIFSAFFGMLINMDYFANPTLLDFDVTKGIVAHASLLFNVGLLKVYRKNEINFKRNSLSIIIFLVTMYLLGKIERIVLEVVLSKNEAISLNPMFIDHSPISAAPFLRFELIASIAIVLYVIIFYLLQKRQDTRTI